MLILTKFSFLEADWALGYNSMTFRIFLVFSNFLRPKVLSRSATREATRLSLIITLRFTCGERKICSFIKMSQNITNMVVDKQLQMIRAGGIILRVKKLHVEAAMYRTIGA